ncbi:MAG: SURF1 family protein [Acetobacteraceae bacterium]
MASRVHRLFWPGLMALLMFLILLGLGTWQVKRLAWKEGILAQIAAGESAAAIPLPESPGAYVKVSVTGRFRRDLTALFGADVRDFPSGPVMGAQLVVPLERADGPPVLVDRGWIPLSVQVPVQWPDGPVTIDGYVQAPQKPGLFTPAPDTTHRRFYALDPAVMGAALGLPRVAPFTLVAMGPTRPGDFPAPPQHLPRPPNNHLEYALTWYGLAGALVVVFITWSRKVLSDDSV